MRKVSVSMLLVMLVTMMTMTSCDDDDRYWSPLVGDWYLTDMPGVDYNEFHFYDDGTGEYYISDYLGQSTYYFTWESYDNYLAVYFNTGEVWEYTWAMQYGYLYLYPRGSGVPLVYSPY